jgi:hypothetical protein
LRYARVLLFGISMLCLCFIFLFTDYKISDREDLNIFITVMCGLFGLILLFIGLFYKAETEHGIRNKWHEKNIE